jgi:hypothetical protein
MPKRIPFYLFITGTIFIVFVLGLVTGGVLFKKPAKPTVETIQPAIQLPVEAPSASVPEPAIEEALVVATAPALEQERVIKYEFQKGMSFVSWTGNGYSNPSSFKSMEELVSLGVEWAGLLTTWFQDEHNSTKIYPARDKTPSDESLIFAIRKLHELKLKVMLKPHVDLVKSEGKWRGEIGFDNPESWQAWFKNYADFMLHYASLATKESVEMLCIGTELAETTFRQPELWRDLISKIKQVYKGPLTYAANWDKEFKEISFWDALDYAGIDPYFPLVASSRPKTEELISVWQDWLNTIEEWQKQINKPVIFTEIGYKSSRDAADEPWQHIAIGELDLELQVNLYKALLETFWNKPWFYGLYWWHWGVNPRMGGALNRNFTPQNKPAQEVIKEWYSKPVAGKAY